MPKIDEYELEILDAYDKDNLTSVVTKADAATFPMQLRDFSTSDGRQYACYSSSSNGRYTIAWRDSDGKGRGGARESGKGTYWLFDGSLEIAKGRVERPNGGLVADDGTFTLEDWLFSQELASVYYVFDVKGDVRVRKRFRANLYNSALSACGRYAVCLTAFAPTSTHSNSLFLFALPAGSLVWRQSAPFAPGAYEFRVSEELLVLTPGRGQEHHQYISCSLSLQPRE